MEYRAYFMEEGTRIRRSPTVFHAADDATAIAQLDALRERETECAAIELWQAERFIARRESRQTT
jgi:hypothetical protein